MLFQLRKPKYGVPQNANFDIKSKTWTTKLDNGKTYVIPADMSAEIQEKADLLQMIAFRDSTPVLLIESTGKGTHSETASKPPVPEQVPKPAAPPADTVKKQTVKTDRKAEQRSKVAKHPKQKQGRHTTKKKKARVHEKVVIYNKDGTKYTFYLK